MDDHLDDSSIHDGIYVPKFHYEEVYKVGPEFDEDMLTTIVKEWNEGDNDELYNTFKNKEGALKGRVIDSRIA